MSFGYIDFTSRIARYYMALVVGIMMMPCFSSALLAQDHLVSSSATDEAVSGEVAEPSSHPSKVLITDDVIKGLQAYGQEDVFQIVLGVCNEKNKNVSDSDYASLDEEWKKELGQEDQPAIARALTNPLSLRVTQMQAESDGLFLEVFVMDAKGLNCGQSSATSDYWQGDEDKWQKTYLVGADAVFIDEPELNEDLGLWTAQVNLSIKDKESNAVLGAVTYEMNLDELERRTKQGVKLF